MSTPSPGDARAIALELTHGFERTAAEVVPWFLAQMPKSYFADFDAAARLTHLRALIAARASGQPLQLMLMDAGHYTFIDELDVPGLLARLTEKLPADRPLRAAKVHTAADGSMVLDHFVMGEGPRFDPNDSEQTKKLEECIIRAASMNLPLEAVRQHLMSCASDYLRTVRPSRALKNYQLVQQVSGTDDSVADLEAKHEPGLFRASLTAANATPRRLFQRCAALLGVLKLDIRRAHLDVFPDGKNGGISMFSFVFRAPDLDAARSKTLSEELGRLKWISDDSFFLHRDVPGVGLIRAEIAIALGALVHQVLNRVNALAFARERVQALLRKHLELTLEIVDLFSERTRPGRALSEADFQARVAKLKDAIEHRVEGEDARRVVSTALGAVVATLRTNLHLPNRYGLAIRLEPSFLLDARHPEKPYGVFFVHGRRFDGFHVRFRDIARGGVRVVRPAGNEQLSLETDRVFQEAYDLAYAQELKNKDIPEGGAKGVVVAAADISVQRAVKGFIDGLLDLIVETDEVKANRVDLLGRSEVLYLGPDENITPDLIEWIVERAERRGHSVPASFMTSKPGAGINHKEYGVTSEGVTVFLEAALHEVGIDPRKDTFTVKITGGPDGDVAGNEIRILHREFGDRARILGIADGSGSAEDPDGLAHAELLRLFQAGLPIADFDRKQLGKNGRVTKLDEPEGFQRRNTLHNRIVADAFVPGGGRPNTIHEGNWRNYLDENGKPTSKVIVEGANLFLTPDARQALGQAGVLIVKDSSANKCGVICSSFEVVASMLLDHAEFMSFKPRFVEEVLVKLRAIARAEAELLFRERRRRPDLDLPAISQRLSKLMKRASESIERALDQLSPPEQAELMKMHLPAILIEKAGDRIATRMPERYRRWTVATVLANDIVYREGIDYLEPLADGALATLALAYRRASRETATLIRTVIDSGIPDRERIAKILTRAGARGALESS